MPYRPLDHTADLGIEVEAPTLNDLFREAGEAMFREMLENFEEVRPAERRSVSLQEQTLEDLFTGFLSELLFYFDAEGFVTREVRVSIDPELFLLEGEVRGEPFDPQRHRVRVGIKGITYHMLTVEQRGDHWYARVIFDV